MIVRPPTLVGRSAHKLLCASSAPPASSAENHGLNSSLCIFAGGDLRVFSSLDLTQIEKQESVVETSLPVSFSTLLWAEPNV